MATRSHPPADRSQVETCAPCHSRRSALAEPATPGRPLLDSHRLALLEPGLYHVDGQILDEVYVYGSFLQSRMYQAGVTCSDCHDPHALQVRGDANQRCSGCHAPERFDTPDHHHHPAGSSGSSCVECHMPSRTYMQIDARRDHGFRVPRPDLSIALGVPNACNQCHEDRDAVWADRASRDWWGSSSSDEPHFATVLAASRSGAPDASEHLLSLARDLEQPAIVRATALAELGRLRLTAPATALRALLRDESPLVRSALATASVSLPEDRRAEILAPLFDDPILAVRIEAARQAATLPTEAVPQTRRSSFDQALAEYRDSLLENAERPDANLGLGVLALQRGDLASAESAYLRARELGPWYQPAAINLADLYRATGRDPEGERTLRQALESAPEAADLHHALGLLLVRSGRLSEALASLGEAADLRPEDPRYAYVHAVAIEASGNRAEALRLLTEAWRRFPSDLDILGALVAYSRADGDADQALLWGRRLADVAPQDDALRQMLSTLEAEADAR